VQQPFMNRFLLGSALTVAFGSLAFGHIRMAPTESTAGAREKYTMRVPNEKKVTCSRIEGEFPAGLDIYDFEFKPGWKIEFKKNDAGKIIGATWTGTMQPYEFVEFGMLGINPKKPRTSYGSSSNITMTEQKKSLRVQWGPGCHPL
jgi:uncharacterized protein YcnI